MPAESFVDFGVIAMLVDDDWDPQRAGNLLGLDVAPFNVDGLTEAIEGSGEIDGLKVIHAWGLGMHLLSVEALAEAVIRDGEFDEDEDYAAESRRLFAHLSSLQEFAPGAATFDEFVASLMPVNDEAGDEAAADGPTVEVYKQKGVYKRRCSECGDIDGQNTKEDLAQKRAADHLRDTHGIEVTA